MGKPRKAVSKEIGDDILVRLNPKIRRIVGLTMLKKKTEKSSSILIKLFLKVSNWGLVAVNSQDAELGVG